MRIDLLHTLCQWEMKRTPRLQLEAQFSGFSGLLHGIELHSPYTLWGHAFDMLDAAAKHKGKKIMVSGGDSINLDMWSRFYKKNGAQVDPNDEIDTLVKFLKECEKVYDKIVFLETNHERRAFKVVMENMPDREVAKSVAKRIETLKETFEKNRLNKIVYVDNYFILLGDALFSHFEANSSVPGTLDRNIVQFVLPRMERRPNVIYQFHSHGQSRIPIDRILVIEAGACIYPLDYWRQGRLSGKNKLSTFGYCKGIMKDGVSDLNEANFHICGWEPYL